MLTASSPLTNIYSLNDDDHILRKLQPKGTWFLTVLGSLATTQREYVALHAFRRLNVQVTYSLGPSAFCILMYLCLCG